MDPAQRSMGVVDLDGLEEVDEPPFQRPPLVAGRLAFNTLADQPLRGAPIREGELWYLYAEEKVDLVRVALHVNGFSFLHGEREVSVSVSPFALVRNCKFQSSCSHLAKIKIFKVSLFTQGSCYYYGVRGEDERWAEEERSRWVADISRVMRLVTVSLFPSFGICCDPLDAVARTRRRIMAGYLVHRDDAASASVLYCELHPQFEDHAKLAAYENELCQVPVIDIYFTECSVCSEKVGINCTCFSIEEHQFSARTIAERKLWLRAISNIKVKLQNHAPAPTREELRHYRLAIKEHLDTIRSSLDCYAPMDALLQRSMRRQRPSPLERAEPAVLSSLGSLPPPPGYSAAEVRGDFVQCSTELALRTTTGILACPALQRPPQPKHEEEGRSGERATAGVAACPAPQPAQLRQEEEEEPGSARSTAGASAAPEPPAPPASKQEEDCCERGACTTDPGTIELVMASDQKAQTPQSPIGTRATEKGSVSPGTPCSRSPLGQAFPLPEEPLQPSG